MTLTGVAKKLKALKSNNKDGLVKLLKSLHESLKKLAQDEQPDGFQDAAKHTSPLCVHPSAPAYPRLAPRRAYALHR